MLNTVGFSICLKNYIFIYMPSTYSLRASSLLRRSAALGAGWAPPRDFHSIHRPKPLQTFRSTDHFPRTRVLGRAALYHRYGGRSSYCRAPNGIPWTPQSLGGNLAPNHFWPIVIGSTGSFRLFCTEPISSGAASDLSLENGQVADSVIASEKKPPCDRTLKLLSGSCYLPHPDKEATGGEDAHFICIEEQAIGVADGVGGWADQGIDAGKYARQLMSNAVNAIREHITGSGSIDPAMVLEKAYFKTKEKGSSTACIIVLTDQDVHAVNIGDSGFIAVREGSIISRSLVQQHEFNMPYQLDSGGTGDLPSAAQGEVDGNKGLILNSRAINIIWGGEGSKGRYWRRWITDEGDASCEVVELSGVYWLEITGSIPHHLLSPGTTYNFTFNLKLGREARGWDKSRVILSVLLSGNVVASAAVDMLEYADGEWVDVPDGGLEFFIPEDYSSTVSFSMYEIEGEEWKRGLVIREVSLVPQPKLRTII